MKHQKLRTSDQFRRSIHRAKNLRTGVVNTRPLTDLHSLPNILHDLCKNPIYREIVATNAFPRDETGLKKTNRLSANTDLEEELLWNASVLSLFASEIERYSVERAQFEICIYWEQFDDAERILTSVEATFGKSIWLIESRLLLLQLSKSPKEQKEFLNSIISKPGVERIIACLSYFLSYRIDDYVSLNTIDSAAKDSSFPGSLDSYIRFYLYPDYSKVVRDISGVLQWEENSPIIDRFNTFVSMIRLYLTHDDYDARVARTCVSLLSPTQESRLQTLSVLLGITAPSAPSSDLSVFDRYVEGDYAGCMAIYEEMRGKVMPTHSLDVFAKSVAQLEAASNGSFTSQEGLVTDMARLILLDRNLSEIESRLEKRSLVLRGQDASLQICKFLSSQQNFDISRPFTPIEKLFALSCNRYNPWNERILRSLVASWAPPQNLLSSLCVRFHGLVDGSQEDADASLAQMRLPPYRATAMRGRVSYLAGDYRAAMLAYGALAATSDRFWTLKGRACLFGALQEQGDTIGCLKLVFSSYLYNQKTIRLFPMGVLEANVEQSEPYADHPFLIANIIFILNKHGPVNLERTLSDSYDAAMTLIGLRKPTEVPYATLPGTGEELVFFMENVCTTRVLEDSIEFDSLSAVMSERISTCQLLLEMNALNKTSLREEIRRLTRDLQVSELHQQVDDSKLFVDVEGIRLEAEQELGGTYKRYLAASEEPQTQQSKEEVRRRYQKILRVENDLTDILMPATDKRAIFESLLNSLLTKLMECPRAGLDAHIGTRIRHGVLEGAVLGAAAQYDLVSWKPVSHAKRLENFLASGSTEIDEESMRKLSKARAAMDRKMADAIAKSRDEIIQVGGKEYRSGLLFLKPSDDQLDDFAQAAATATSFDDFFQGVVEAFWVLTNECLQKIRHHIDSDFRGILNAAIDAYIAALKSVQHWQAADEARKLTERRIAVNTAVSRIRDWFKQPQEQSRPSFPLSVAIQVAKTQICRCYPGHNFEPTIDCVDDAAFGGTQVNAIIIVLFNLFENIIRHGKTRALHNAVSVVVKRLENCIAISVLNEVPDDVDISALNIRIAVYRNASIDLDRAKRDFKSGLWKIRRILAFELGRECELILSPITETRNFQATICIYDMASRVC